MKFIYFAIGKTGTTSIESYINKFHDDKKFYKHASPECVSTEKISKYFTFCFVRNPWDRLISMYKQFQKPNNLDNAVRKKHYTISNKYKFIDYVRNETPSHKRNILEFLRFFLTKFKFFSVFFNSAKSLY